MAYVKGQPFIPQFTDPATGLLMTSGTIEFYLTGTSTPTPYYTDSAGTSGGTSLTLDAGGKPATDIYYDDTVTYKLVVKNSSGSVIDTIDPFSAGIPASYVESSDLSADSGASLVGYKEGSASSVSRTVESKFQEDLISVLDFGATLDGATDDTTAFQAADAAANGRKVYVPYTSGGCKVDIFTASSLFVFDVSFNNSGTAKKHHLNAFILEEHGRLKNVKTNNLPIGKQTRSSSFNDQIGTTIYSNGATVQYYGIQPYDYIDFTKQGGAVTDYYVNYSTGNDSNAGTSSGAAWKTINKVFSTVTTDAIVHIEDDVVGFLSNSTSSRVAPANIKFIGEGPSGKTLFLSLRDDVTKASFSWTDNGDGSWTTTAPLRIFNAMFDRRYLDDEGLPTPLTAASSKANCQATAGTFFETGTSELTVHLLDGREPDPIVEGGDWIPVSTEQRIEIQSDDKTVLYENIDFVNNQGASAFGGIRHRSVTTATPSTARFGAKNCNSYGSSGNGFEIYDAKITAIESCKAQYVHKDGFNYHSFVTTGGKGDYISVYEYGACVARFCGYDEWANQAALGDSNNGSTSHDGIHIERLNTVCSETYGAVIADVGLTISENWNVKASKPNHGVTAAPQSCFWAETTNTKMWLWGCYGESDDANTKVFETTDGGIIYVKEWQGDEAAPTWNGNVWEYSGDVL